MKSLIRALVLFLSSFILVACFGGGGGGGSAPTYTIGGTVSGLAGTGLILQNNNSDDLAISANGDFTFDSALANTSAYNVTVLTQPSAPDQFCAVTSASGTVSGANVTNISVTCSKVLPLYNTKGVDWNDYVQGNDIASATDTACYADTDTACIHAGEIRLLELSTETSCTGITATDVLGAFEWTCDDSTGSVRVISTGLKDGKGLSDLMDFVTPGWKQNTLMIFKNSVEIEATTPAVWWSNPAAIAADRQLDMEGAIYVVTVSTTASYQMAAHKVALVAAPGTVITGDVTDVFDNVIFANLTNFLWLEGLTVDAAGQDKGVYWLMNRFSVMRDIVVSGADTGTDMLGIYISSSGKNRFTNITANNNSGHGILIGGVEDEVFLNLKANDNGNYGIYLNGSPNNKLTNLTANNNVQSGIGISSDNVVSNVIASNNGAYGVVVSGYRSMLSSFTLSNNALSGIYFESASNSSLSDVTANNNHVGIHLWSSSNNTFSNVTTSNNHIGFYLANSSNANIAQGVSATNNSHTGAYIEQSSYNILARAILSNNEQMGLYFLSAPTNNTFSDLVISDNGSYGLYITDASANHFTGELKFGNNTSGDCYVSGGTNPGLVDGTCANEGASDATLTTGVTITNTFVAKVNVDDSVNISDANGAATITDLALSFDWTSFESPSRIWGVDGNTFPDVTNRGLLGCSNVVYTNQTDCEGNSFTWSGNARIWDWSLQAGDTVAKDVLLLPIGSDALTHTWSDASSTTFLRNAVEIQNDDIGNDNTVCETGETCLYTPNISSYQGHGSLVSAGSIGTGGTLENITLMKYETNGY